MSGWQIIRWWEIRRIYYNAALLVIGLAAVASMFWLTKGFAFIGDGIGSVGLVGGMLLYGLAANACYTLGWILELQEQADDPVRAHARAK